MKVHLIFVAIVLAAFLVVRPNMAGDLDAGPTNADDSFVSMDFDSSGQFNIGDVSALLMWLYLGGPAPDCREAMDFNANGRINVIDAVSGLNFLFTHTQAVPAMGAGCQAYPGCDSGAGCP